MLLELGGYGGFNDAHVHITQKIVHEGEVNRARYQFENPNIIATKSRSGDVYVFDRTTHESFPKDNEPFNPALKLKGHTKEGYGLAWNPHKTKSTHLVSAGFDHVVCHWDIAAASRENRTLQPFKKYQAHTDSVMDVNWYMKHDSIFASVGDDKSLIIWDIRDQENKPVHHQTQAHDAPVNCVGFSPSNEWILATGSSDTVSNTIKEDV